MYSQMQSEVHWRVCHQSAPNAQQVRVHIACITCPDRPMAFRTLSTSSLIAWCAFDSAAPAPLSSEREFV